ncbi:MAG TPA: pyridoxal-dependent decarboxylase [Pyrinomonadaceae bacterium]|jgi:aromatic-L-amino-acid decarboxylase|nr:pyridoxal-dependent decarboxylase [Pyrinomonadaceae bacterium]
MNESKDVMKPGDLPLGDMSSDDLRRHGAEVINRIADYLENIEDLPVVSQVEPNWLKENLPSSAPQTGEDFADILADVDKFIIPALTHWNHPHFHGLFSTSTSAPGILAEAFSAAFDVKGMLWRTSPAATELEQVTMSWLRQMLGLPEEYFGIIYDTASVSTMHAIAVAREKLDLRIREEGMSGRPDLPLLRVYCSEQTHSSIDKSLLTLGLGLRALRKIPVNDRFEMLPEKLAEAIEEDKANGILPFCVIPTIGTTSTTSVDPVDAIADICEKHGLWMHVDAAYAGPTAMLEEMRPHFKGWERADSIVLNPHKWLFTPMDCSVLYVRDLPLLKKTFTLVAEYLKTDEEVENMMDYGLQLGRRFRALKLWFVMRYFGREGLAARIREHCRLAKKLEQWIAGADGWELMAPAHFALVCFRAAPDGLSEEELNHLNEKLMNDINASGKAYLSHTKLNGKFTLRLSIGSIRFEERHLEEIKEILEQHFSHELHK